MSAVLALMLLLAGDRVPRARMERVAQVIAQTERDPLIRVLLVVTDWRETTFERPPQHGQEQPWPFGVKTWQPWWTLEHTAHVAAVSLRTAIRHCGFRLERVFGHYQRGMVRGRCVLGSDSRDRARLARCLLQGRACR